MARFHSQTFTVTVRVALPHVEEMPVPALTLANLADPDEGVDAAMDYSIPRDGDPEIMREAQRRLLSYIGWLLDDAPARHPSWAEDELQRAVRRLVEVRTAVKRQFPKPH